MDIFQSKLRFYIPSRNSSGLLWIQDETKGLINKEITGIKFSSFGKYDKLKDAIINDTELCNTLRRLLLTPFDLDEIKAIKEEAEAAIGRKIKQSIIDKVTKKGRFSYVNENAKVKVEISTDYGGKFAKLEAVPGNCNPSVLKDFVRCTLKIANHLQAIYPP